MVFYRRMSKICYRINRLLINLRAMDTDTMFLAQLLGVFYLVIGLSVLLKKEYYTKLFKTIEKNGMFVMMMGIFTLLVGVIMVMLHSKWTGGVDSLVSIIGWIALLKGIFTLLFPQWSINLAKNVVDENGVLVMGVAGSILGLILMYFGFLV